MGTMYESLMASLTELVWIGDHGNAASERSC